MSSTDIFKITKTESKKSESIPNAWAFAMFIWNALSNEYNGENFNMFTGSTKTWNLIDDPKVDLFKREVLLLTMDKTLVKKENLSKLKTSLKQFNEVHSGSAIPKLIQWITENESKDDFEAMGLHCNSISCEQWYDYSLENDEHDFLYEDDAISKYYD